MSYKVPKDRIDTLKGKHEPVIKAAIDLALTLAESHYSPLLESLECSLKMMVDFAEKDFWNLQTSGRQLTLKQAKEALEELAKYKQP